MTNERLDALERETAMPGMRAVWGTSPAAKRANEKESATALAGTLSKLTATDVARICMALHVEPKALLHSGSHDLGRINT